jgi:hypothetical protein
MKKPTFLDAVMIASAKKPKDDKPADMQSADESMSDDDGDDSEGYDAAVDEMFDAVRKGDRGSFKTAFRNAVEMCMPEEKSDKGFS